LSQAISPADGFRRRATPGLVYRYFADMKKVFSTLSNVTKKRGRLAFVVGSNHTTLGGRRFEINTPTLLAEIAIQRGFHVVDQMELQTYHRYDLHRKNSIRCESLTIFELG
jgi:site-specific DNA-methyltransferase (cytosine-N4-specific)